MEALEPKEQWYLLQGKIAHLHGKILRLRKEIKDLTATIGIENLGIHVDNGPLLPRIDKEIMDNALTLLDRAQVVVKLQDEYNDARTKAIQVRQIHYDQTKELLDDPRY